MTDEEKDARDYQLQRAMDMVRALSKVGKKNLEKVEEETASDSKDAKPDDKKSETKKQDVKKEDKKSKK